MATNPILQAAALRGRGLNQDAIDHIEANLNNIHPDYLVNAYREAFFAARDSGQVQKAKEYAEKIAADEPDLPSIKGWV